MSNDWETLAYGFAAFGLTAFLGVCAWLTWDVIEAERDDDQHTGGGT
jgi:hypothetical protein